MMRRHGVPALAMASVLVAVSACGSGSVPGGGSPGSAGSAPADDAPGRSDAGLEIASPFATGASRSTPETLWHCRGDGRDGIDVFHFGADGGGTLAAGAAAESVPLEWRPSDGDVDVTFASGAADIRLAEIEFASPVLFSTVLRSGGTPYGERSCELHALDGTPLVEAPFFTPYGPASHDRPSPPLAASLPAGLSMVMVQEFGIDGFGNTSFRRSAVMTFEDGSFTRDVAGVLLRGVEGSRADRPGDWGEWRGEAADGSFALREDGRDFDEVPAVPGSPPGSGQRLAGCHESSDFVSVPGAGIGTTTDGFSSTVYCFFADGAFSNRRASSATSPDFVAGASSDATGRYRIEGNAIDLEFGDGRVVRHVFGRYASAGDPSFAVSLDATVLARPLPD